MADNISILSRSTTRTRKGDIPVFLRITRHGERFLLNTGLTSCGKVENNHFPNDERNKAAKERRLANLILNVEAVMLNHPNERADKLKVLIQQQCFGKKPKEKLFVDYMAEFAATRLKESTRVLYRITRDKVLLYDKSATFSTINYKWLQGFEKELLKTLTINGTSINLRNIRAVFNWAITEEYTDCYPFRKFKIRQEKTKKRNLKIDELRNLRDAYCEPCIEIYRDLFMLSFYLCGINAGDMLMCKKLVNGRFVYHRQKTGKLYDIPVMPEAMEIIKKYKGKNWLLSPLDTYKDYHDFLHHWNRGLRHIGQTYMEGKGYQGEQMFSELTTYWARHTFASIAAEIDIPRETIALCLGHSWTDVTDIYIDYDLKKIDKAVRKVIDYVNGKDLVQFS